MYRHFQRTFIVDCGKLMVLFFIFFFLVLVFLVFENTGEVALAKHIAGEKLSIVLVRGCQMDGGLS